MSIIHELYQALLEKWDSLPGERRMELVISMISRHKVVIAGVHERLHIYTLMQTHINPEMTAIRPIPLLLPHHHKSVPGEKRVGNQP